MAESTVGMITFIAVVVVIAAVVVVQFASEWREWRKRGGKW